jgi:hypothetical protein
MPALVALVLWKGELQLVPWLKAGIAKRMNGEAAPEREARDRAARDPRRQAVSLSRSEFEMNRVHHAMNQIEPAKVKALLMEIEDILSPGTTGEQVRPDFC